MEKNNFWKKGKKGDWYNMKKLKMRFRLLSSIFVLCMILSGCAEVSDFAGEQTPVTKNSVSLEEKSDAEDSILVEEENPNVLQAENPISENSISINSIPEYSGTPYVVINNNEPEFAAEDFITTSFEEYSELDELGRCGIAYANLCTDTMPTEKRGNIGQVKPSGWHSVRYDCVEGKSLYNRCHLIGFQLSAENANKQNLITGTRYLNVQGMLPFEDMVADYIKETENHVLYRVTPIFEGDNLVASGVQMEASSVEDNGEGVCFNVYCYNVQPQITIDYLTGESSLSSENIDALNNSEDSDQKQETYILNTNSLKFHLPSCTSAAEITEENKQEYHGTREGLVAQGYAPCGRCKP